MSGNNKPYLVGEQGPEIVSNVQAASILDSRDYIRLECTGCGATLPRKVDPECEYCGAKYAKVRRYSGPAIPEKLLSPGYPDAIGQTFGSSCVSTNFSINTSFSTCSVIYLGSDESGVGDFEIEDSGDDYGEW